MMRSVIGEQARAPDRRAGETRVRALHESLVVRGEDKTVGFLSPGIVIKRPIDDAKRQEKPIESQT